MSEKSEKSVVVNLCVVARAATHEEATDKLRALFGTADAGFVLDSCAVTASARAARTIEGIRACADSLLAPLNLKDVTDSDYAELVGIYERLLTIQTRVVMGSG